VAAGHASTRLAPADGAAAPKATLASDGIAVSRRRWAAPVWLPAVIAALAGLVAGGYRWVCRRRGGRLPLGVPSPWREEAAAVDAAQRSVPAATHLASRPVRALSRR
jgi:hypothetical protein